MREFLQMVVRVAPMQFLVQAILRIVLGMTPAVSSLVWRSLLLEAESSSADERAMALFAALALVGGIAVSYPYFTEIIDTLLRNRLSSGMQKLVHQKAD